MYIVLVITVGVLAIIALCFAVCIINKQRIIINRYVAHSKNMYYMNKNANNEIAELRALLRTNMHAIKDLSELFAVNSETCKNERFYNLCRKRFTVETDKFILKNVQHFINVMHDNAMYKFLKNKRVLSEKEILVCSLIFLDFSISTIQILCKYGDIKCIYTLTQRIKNKLKINDSKHKFRQHLRIYASTYNVKY